MDKARAKQVLDRIDQILRWEQRVTSRRTRGSRSSASTCARCGTSGTGGSVMEVLRNSWKLNSPTRGARPTT